MCIEPLTSAAGGRATERIVGFLIYWLVHDEVHILNVAVSPEHRRRGIARTLMSETEKRAVQAGAISLMEPADMDYGERGAAIEDVGGNHWYLATATGPSYVPEGLPNLMPYFNPRGAPKMIAFLKEAFNAEEIARHQSPEGIVHHAKIRIGDSIIEMGEAHGAWQPRPMHFMVYVDDCDAWYARAMKAEGAVSMGEPANAPYGGRTGTIKDPFGNTWYLNSQMK